MKLMDDGTPTSGEVVWKDVTTDIVSNLAVSSDKEYLTFTVSADDIVQGNAVVAVKDDEGLIMWSWHLWFTDSGALSTTAFNASNEIQYFMRDNLGYVFDTYSGTTYVTPRRVRVTVTQSGSNQTAQFQIIQNPYMDITFHDTKYQFGRKDAFSGSSVGAPTIVSGKIDKYYKSILNPGTFYTYGSGTEDWTKSNYYDAWAVGNYGGSSNEIDVSTSAIVKSVFDPCPAGFKMPARTAFTSFSMDNGTWAAERKGHTFTDSSMGTSVFFPASGIINHHNGTLGGVNYNCCCWSAILNRGVYYAYCLSLYSYSVTPISSKQRAYGLSVRPVKNN